MSQSVWGLTAALADWGGLVTPAKTNLEKAEVDADEPEPTNIDATPASDAELDAMTKSMESGISSALAGFGIGGGGVHDRDGDMEDSVENSDSSFGKGVGVNSKIDAVPASENDLAAVVKDVKSGITAAMASFGLGGGSTSGGAGRADLSERVNHLPVELESAAAAASSAVWSALGTISDLKAPTAVIGEWIDDLQKENDGKDPYRDLRESLDEFLRSKPQSTYEEWVEHLLIKEGWDEDSAVVDDSFYWEKSPHRNVWNERNIEDGIDVGEGETRRAYVEARDSGEKSIENADDGSRSEEVVFF